MGNLRHLQTLEVRGTNIFELPTSITNLRKLQNIRAPVFYSGLGNVKGEESLEKESKI
jgi:hypothetical protein